MAATTKLYKKVVKDDTTASLTTLFTCPAGKTCLLLSLLIASKSASGVDVTVRLTDSATGKQIYWLKDVNLPQGSTLNGLPEGKVVLQPGDIIQVMTSITTTADMTLSYIEDVN